MIDLHCHVLPGVDDGPETLDDALMLCRAAARDGCEILVATPHLYHPLYWNGDRARLEQVHGELCEALGPPTPAEVPEVRLGGEIALGRESAEQLQALPEGRLLTLGGSRYLLLELDPRGLGPDPVEVVHELKVGGFVPILAHPERVRWLIENPRLLEALLESGALLQLTGRALTGHFGKSMERICRDLLDAGLVAFVASDAHDTVFRPPGLSDAFEVVRQGWGDAVADALFRLHPRRVVDNEPWSSTL